MPKIIQIAVQPARDGESAVLWALTDQGQLWTRSPGTWRKISVPEELESVEERNARYGREHMAKKQAEDAS